MWTTANQRMDRKLRRTLLITSVEGKGIGSVGAGQTSAGGNGVETAGKIVIAGWTGEPFVARHPARARPPSAPPGDCAVARRTERG